MSDEYINGEFCRCGKKWGHHFDDVVMIENVKLFCVKCDSKIQGQCVERYRERGNYCGRCSNESKMRGIHRNY